MNLAVFARNRGKIVRVLVSYRAFSHAWAFRPYNGEKIVLMAATDQPPAKAQADVTADLLGRIGANVDYQAMDWGTMTSRRASMKPPSEGG